MDPKFFVNLDLKMRKFLKFVTAYKKSLIILLAPLVFLPLLFVEEKSAITEDDLCKLFQKENENCQQTLDRISQPGEEPTLFKVETVKRKLKR